MAVASLLEPAPCWLAAPEFTGWAARALNAVERAKPSCVRLRVLDVGCGDGAVTRTVAEYGHHVVGLDVDAETLRVTERLSRELPAGQRPRWVLARAEDLVGWPAETYDVVLAGNVLHHVEDTRKGLAGAWHVLAPHGRLLVADKISDVEREDDPCPGFPLRTWMRWIAELQPIKAAVQMPSDGRDIFIYLEKRGRGDGIGHSAPPNGPVAGRAESA